MHLPGNHPRVQRDLYIIKLVCWALVSVCFFAMLAVSTLANIFLDAVGIPADYPVRFIVSLAMPVVGGFVLFKHWIALQAELEEMKKNGIEYPDDEASEDAA
jgi:TRAP-type C4-dicarboxylate transport system permease small subunit